jgi:hypothetical protein
MPLSHPHNPPLIGPLSAAIALATHLAPAAAEIDFAHQVVPILKEYCAECHGGTEAKGSFSINSRALFLDKDNAIPGDPEGSLFIELIEDPDPDYQMPPEKKPRVPAAQVAILRRWVEQGLPWEPGFSFAEGGYEPPLKPRLPELPAPAPGRPNPIDRLIDHYLAARQLPTPDPIDDSTFLRRAHLDLIGLLPSPAEVSAFLADPSPDRRQNLVSSLLDREIDYADHWLTFWNDLLRNDYDGTGFITGGRTQISGWLYHALRTNRPFDQMVSELVAPPSQESAGFINGIQWRGEVSAGQTLPIQFAQSVSQSFLGINMKCASCHDSFIDRWTLDEAYGLAAIYSDKPLEIHRCDIPAGRTATAAWLFPEIGQVDPDAPKDQRLSQLASLMTHPDNGRVTRTIANRLWGQLMGRGIVHPLDAMQTEPWHEDLLDFLAADLQQNGYDLKHTIALITSSAAYQSRASQAADTAADTATYTYAGPATRRLTAEQFTDAIWQITGTAPPKFDAPIDRLTMDPQLADQLQRTSTWIWGPSAADGKVPNGGDQILLRKKFPLSKPLASAALIATADNIFSLHINGKPVLSGDNWEQPGTASLTGTLADGDNELVFLATNSGTEPSPAGAFCLISLRFTDGTTELIATDASWQVSQEFPQDLDLTAPLPDGLKWLAATPVSHPAWTQKTSPSIATFLAGSPPMTRASLVKADFLMRSLGRPNRDQIVTSRPNELTTLEAIDLSNDASLASSLQRGAEHLLAQALPSTTDLLDHLYLATLSRHPSPEELAIFAELWPDKPSTPEIADALWALVMSPEFLLLR